MHLSVRSQTFFPPSVRFVPSVLRRISSPTNAAVSVSSRWKDMKPARRSQRWTENLIRASNSVFASKTRLRQIANAARASLNHCHSSRTGNPVRHDCWCMHLLGRHDDDVVDRRAQGARRPASSNFSSLRNCLIACSRRKAADRSGQLSM